ncbi:TetR/AcrR family transcriptional regulator [Frateuria defendens]|uniref:TetR/AcrR family transcriptional regulator n=1 Tax=Frateuria defendens TaxID=2219559 RepID=UPI00066FC764|nr:TetR/AcrR family transcriptional regulator [Frateuria defendens]
MARPRNFDRDQVLDTAIHVFREHGFEGTSTEELVAAMGIGRQSLYGAFGDKRSLYLEALRRYSAHSVADLIGAGRGSGSPLQAIEAMLRYFTEHHARAETAACLGVGAICEFGTADAQVRQITHESGLVLGRFLERTLGEAQALGEIDAALDIKASARFIATTLMGMKVAARGGASAGELRGIAELALRSLAR